MAVGARGRNDCEGGGDCEVYCETDRDGNGDVDSDAYRAYIRFRHGGRGISQVPVSALCAAKRLCPVEGLVPVEGVKTCARRWRPLADGQPPMSSFSCGGRGAGAASALTA